MPARRHRFGMVLRGLALGLCLWLIAPPPLAALNKNEIRELEDLLAQLGFDPGPIDGVLDAQTRTAIKGYQDFAALPVTGQASWSLLDEVRGVTDSLGDVRIPQSVPQAVAGPEAAKAQEKVTEPAFAAPKPPGPKPAAPEKAPVETAPVETAAVQTEATETPAAATAPASTGPATFEIALQLAAFRSEEEARRGWAQMQQQLPDLLGGMSPRFPAVDLGEEGIYYRVLTGPFPNRATAANLCAMVRAEGQACLVIQSAPQQIPEVAPPQASAEPTAPEPAAAPAPLHLAEAATSAVSPEGGAPPATKKMPVSPPSAEPSEATPPEASQLVAVETSAPAPEEVAAVPEESTEPTPSETPQLAALPEVGAPALQSADEVFDLNDCQRAIQLYTQLMEQGGLTSRRQAGAHNNRGRCYLDEKYFEEAIADFNSAIGKWPDYAAAFFNRGRAHQAVGEAALAQADMQRAYDLGFNRLGL
jgi:hypothetical protein